MFETDQALTTRALDSERLAEPQRFTAGVPSSDESEAGARTPEGFHVAR